LLSNDSFDWRDVPDPLARCTMQRMAQEKLGLCLQDTTELDFNGRTIEDLGPLSYEAQRGMYLHPTYAVSAQREPLGLLDAWMWAGEPKDAHGVLPGITESVRWVEGDERLAERAPELPGTRLVQVSDRESDMLGLMLRAQALGWPVDWLVRLQHDRVVPDATRLWAQVQACDSLGEIEFTMAAGPGRKARVVRQELRVKRMSLSTEGDSGLLTTCLIASEMGAPKGEVRSLALAGAC